MARKSKIINVQGKTLAEVIKLLQEENPESTVFCSNSYGDTARSFMLKWEEPPLFKVEADMTTPRSWQVINTKTCEIEASGIRLKSMAEYISNDLNKRFDK